MAIKAVLFDLYGTLAHIETDEEQGVVFWGIAQFLDYHRMRLSADALRMLYREKIQQQKAGSGEKYPEIRQRQAWEDILQEGSKHFRSGKHRSDEEVAVRRRHLAKDLVRLFRALSRKHLSRYPGAKTLLQELRGRYRIGMVSDAQPEFAKQEMRRTKIRKYFSAPVISAQYGYRKPDPRLFQQACHDLGVAPSEAIFVGNDMYRDIYGAHRVGMKTIWVDSGQGRRSYQDLRADYDARDLRQVLDGIHFLA